MEARRSMAFGSRLIAARGARHLAGLVLVLGLAAPALPAGAATEFAAWLEGLRSEARSSSMTGFMRLFPLPPRALASGGEGSGVGG